MIYLYKYRESAGLSIYKLSKLTGISRQNLMKLEKGSQPTAPVIIKLCLALGITPNDLLGWEEKLNEYKRRITRGNDD
ncbi:MAG: helix-turn-helix domain-containing protein [Clostridia bacterium]